MSAGELHDEVLDVLRHTRMPWRSAASIRVRLRRDGIVASAQRVTGALRALEHAGMVRRVPLERRYKTVPPKPARISGWTLRQNERP